MLVRENLRGIFQRQFRRLRGLVRDDDGGSVVVVVVVVGRDGGGLRGRRRIE
jgi:hypothetical protein